MSNFLNCDYLPSGYLINVNGEIKSPRGIILKNNISNSGYICINIKNKGYFIHRAIAFAFIENKNNYPQINHIDGNKLNNNLSNLEWCTRSQNIRHMYDTGLKPYTPSYYKGKFGAEHNRSKAVIHIETGKVYGSQSEAQRELNLGGGSVSWSIKYAKPIYGMNFKFL